MIKDPQHLSKGADHECHDLIDECMFGLKWYPTPDPEFVRQEWPTLVSRAQYLYKIWASYSEIPHLHAEQSQYADKLQQLKQKFVQKLGAWSITYRTKEDSKHLTSVQYKEPTPQAKVIDPKFLKPQFEFHPTGRK